MPEPNEFLVLLEQLKKTVSDGINILSGFDRVEFWLCDIVKKKSKRNKKIEYFYNFRKVNTARTYFILKRQR